MNRRLAFASLLLWSASALGQEAPRPDLSGTWLLDKGKSRLEADQADTAILYIEHEDPRLRLTRAYVSDGKADVFNEVLLANGKEDVKRWKEDSTVYRCRWESDELILESRERKGGKESLTVMKLSLAPDGRTLAFEERFAGPGRKFENTLVLERETAPPTLDVTEADLAEIKAAVLRQFEIRGPGTIGFGFSEDLRRGALFPPGPGHEPGIGSFNLTLRHGRLALVRGPDLTLALRDFGFFLARLDGRWVVLESFYVEQRIGG